MNDVVINKGKAGLGRPLDGEDYISALLAYSNATLPSGFSSGDRIKEVFSIAEAEALGITNTHLGETKASGTITYTVTGTAADTVAMSVTTANGVVSLGSFIVPATPTLTTVAAAAAAAVNAGTLTHGFTSTSSVAIQTLIAPTGTGVGANSYTINAIVASGATAATLVQFASGAGSFIDVLHYHVSEYFRLQPGGNLFIGIYAQGGSYTFSEITTMQNFTGGKIRQIGVYVSNIAFAKAQLDALQTISDANFVANKPIDILYQGDISGTTDLTTLTDLSTATDEDVTPLTGQDGAALGAALYLSFAKSVGILGAALGAVALAKVSESIAWVAKFNFSDGTELDTLAMANGTLIKTLSDGLLTSITNKRYVFLRKIVSIDGSYINAAQTAIDNSSDYSLIQHNRTIKKAVRNVRTFVVPQLSSPIKMNPDGTLSNDVIEFFKTTAGRALEQMQRDGEISAFEVIIDPTQDVNSSGELDMGINIVPIGSADIIKINIGFTTKIS